MNIFRRALLRLSALAALLAVAAVAADSEFSGMRTWTSATGSKTEAAFVRLELGLVHLKTGEGSVVKVRLNQLSAEDQKIAAELAAGAAAAQTQAGGAAPAQKAVSSDRMQRELLTEEQLKSLKAQWTDEKTGKEYEFQVSFGLKEMSTSERKRAERSGEIPYRLLAWLYEVEVRGGKKFYNPMSGTANFYILDAAGDVALKPTKKSLSNMCPT